MIKRLVIFITLLFTTTSAIAQTTTSLSGITCPGSGCATRILSQQGTEGIQITGTFVGTLVFEQTVNGTSWIPWLVTSSGGAVVSSTTAPGLWSGSPDGDLQTRIRFSVFYSGSATITTNFSSSIAGSGDLNASYIIQTPVSDLPNSQVLSNLTTGIIKNTTTTGILSIAVPGTDYLFPSGIGANLTHLTAENIDAGTAAINISGNAATATNGVVTTGSYSDPSWLTVSKSKVGLSAVENTALSTWAGSSNLTTTGTISSGTWSGSFGAVTGANLTHLTAANIDAGTAAINISGSAASLSGSPSFAATTITDTTGAGSGSLAGHALEVNQSWNTTGIPVALQVNVARAAWQNDSKKLFQLNVKTGAGTNDSWLEVNTTGNNGNGPLLQFLGGFGMYPSGGSIVFTVSGAFAGQWSNTSVSMSNLGGAPANTGLWLNWSDNAAKVPLSISTGHASQTADMLRVSSYGLSTGDLFKISNIGVVSSKVLTVATLPAPPAAGMRTFVSDANATTPGTTVAGGGANTVPVFYNGTNWIIG